MEKTCYTKRKRKTYEELTLADDFLFCKVFGSEKELCKELLERLLGEKIRDIVYLQTQDIIELTNDGKGIRLDVYLEDEGDTVYDLEMQCLNTKELPERTRYYHSLIDQDLLEKGESYGSIKNTVIVFVCLFDLFGRGLWKYTFQNRAKECLDLVLEDGQKTVFVNAGGFSGDPKVQNFLNFLNGTETKGSDGFISALKHAVENASHNAKWRCEYMFATAREQCIRDEARNEERRSNIRAMIEEGISRDLVKKILKLTDEDIDHALQEKE